MEDDKVLGLKHAWNRGGAELKKHRLFYFCKVVLLILCFNKCIFWHATRHFLKFARNLLWSIFSVGILSYIKIKYFLNIVQFQLNSDRTSGIFNLHL